MGVLLLGAVAYDPKVVTIWDGFRGWLGEHDFDLDYVLYSHYDRQVDDLLAGRIDMAWNSPLAWVRGRRMAARAGTAVSASVMRDTDRDLTSVIVVRSESAVSGVDDLRGARIAVGAEDSPQATLLPLSMLLDHGLGPGDLEVVYFNVGVGLHGDDIGGERDAARALAAGTVDAAAMTDSNVLLFAREGTLRSGQVRVVGRTATYDHCIMTAGPAADPDRVAAFGTLLQGMSYADARVRPLLDLEGLTRWLPGALTGMAPWSGP
jgi:ABC-type phosphate/phosphonate transport system substrate-binding protein